jgi:transposase
LVEAVSYPVFSGCVWRMLPSSFPPWPTIFAHFRHWRIDGTLRHDRLRAVASKVKIRDAELPAAFTAIAYNLRRTRTLLLASVA